MLTRETILRHRNAMAGVNKSMLTEEFDEMADLALQALDSQWQPIETAPKDRTYLLACEAGRKIPIIVRWEGVWRSDVYGQLDFATHWMRLPHPPKE